MKVKVISRNADDFVRTASTALTPMPRNPAPQLHPFERAREQTRALNAAKVERMFARPFVAALSQHTDAVCTMARHPSRLSTLLSGSCDGDINVWDVAGRAMLWSIPHAHRGWVRALSVPVDGACILSCGDESIKRWPLQVDLHQGGPEAAVPQREWLSDKVLRGLDAHRFEPVFATCGITVDVWDQTRSEPVSSFQWGSESVTSVRWNQVETDVFVSTGTDRSIVLYDRRGRTPIRKLVMAMKTNAVAWNPQEAFNFTAANEDHNAYSFDMRKLDRATLTHKDHVSAVMSVDYAPTGRRFVTGSYDRTVRIWESRAGRSTDVYHTKRMQRVLSVAFSGDAKYVLSGSDDTNVRIWKAVAWEKPGVLQPREKEKMRYQEKLKQRYAALPETQRVLRQRHVPRAIHKASKLKRTMLTSLKRKEENRRRHSAPGAVPHKPERKKSIVAEES